MKREKSTVTVYKKIDIALQKQKKKKTKIRTTDSHLSPDPVRASACAVRDRPSMCVSYRETQTRIRTNLS